MHLFITHEGNRSVSLYARHWDKGEKSDSVSSALTGASGRQSPRGEMKCWGRGQQRLMFPRTIRTPRKEAPSLEKEMKCWGRGQQRLMFPRTIRTPRKEAPSLEK